ncbi:MAG: carbohydrate ABC transporter permease [Sphaerochaetaceae bacterium]
MKNPNSIRSWAKALIYAGLILVAIITLIPFIWLIASTFKSNYEIVKVPGTFFPKKITFEHYTYIVGKFKIFTYFFNSLFLAVIKTGVGVYTSLYLGYMFSKFTFRLKKAMYSLVVFTMTVPALVTMIPTYNMANQANLIDSWWAIILPSVFISFGIFMMRLYITKAVPTALLEAAKIDGAKQFFIFHKVVAPLSTNMISALSIFVFLGSWNDFLWPYLVLNTSRKFPLSVALSMLNGQNNTNYGALFVATLLTIVPILIVYWSFQKSFIEGVSMTGIK